MDNNNNNNKIIENENKKQENDDEEEDEDYDPTKDPENKNDDEGDDIVMDDTDKNNFTLSINQTKAVEDAYSSLFDTSDNALNAKFDIPSTTKSSKKAKEKKRLKRAYKKKYKILSNLFGSKVATKMLLRNNKHIANKEEATIANDTITQLQRKVITETKSFAGQQISIQKVVMQPVTITTATSEPKENTPKTSNLDTILTNIENSNNKISTIEKSNADWETYKQEQNIDGEEFEKRATGNESYLNKKEFLQRVDVRRFEQEKEERERKRVSS